MSKSYLSIVWFRQDLRITDNPALLEATQKGKILPIFILDDENAGEYKLGGASRWWLHYSLQSLNRTLDNQLRLFQGPAEKILQELCETYPVQSVHWNRCYEPWRIRRDQTIKTNLNEKRITVKSFRASVLWEAWKVLKEDKTPFKIFTPFYRKGCLNQPTPSKPLPKPVKMEFLDLDTIQNSKSLDELQLLPKKWRWNKKLEQHWKIGEITALEKLKQFEKIGLQKYKTERNFPAKPYVSKLSPYLHFGEISPNQIWDSISKQERNSNTDHFCSEIGWREFGYYLLYHNPQLPYQNLQEKFDHFPWQENQDFIQAWQAGLTGYPIVDAGMRELWETGYMHNRVRMIVGSFLVKNLLQHWKHGFWWFWDCLVDADLANNSAGWQWISGCGVDSAPYFRIFNPIHQGEKFDPQGTYTKHYLPELKDLPEKYLFQPWEAPTEILKQARVVLGKTYPKPIVALKQSRQIALDAFQSIKKNRPQ